MSVMRPASFQSPAFVSRNVKPIPPITFRSANGANSGGTTSLSVPPPAGIVDNDILIAIVNANNTGNTITPPAGWNTIYAQNVWSATNGVYWKRASGESGNYVFGLSPSTRVTIAIAAFYNCILTGSPIDVNSTSLNTLTAPSVTTTVDNAMLVYLAAEDNGVTGTFTPDAAMTEVWDPNSTAPVTIDYQLLGAAGATGTRTATDTLGGSAQPSSYLVALKP